MAPKDKEETASVASEPTTLSETAPEDAPAVSVPDTDNSEGGKLKMIISLVKKAFGVKDIASMRMSLPASLLEPIPNLEWSQYLDRPDYFAAINDSDDPFERMLAVLRFTFTKDLKYVSGRVFKPYNSVLGEHFRAHWDVLPLDMQSQLLETSSVKSGRSSKSAFSVGGGSRKSPPESVSTDDKPDAKFRVAYVTEQISHHPPVSAYYGICPSRGLEMSGVDQVSPRIAGTVIKVVPGKFNKGTFVHIKDGFGKGENYQITNPVPSVNGILKGSFYITVSDRAIITVTGGKAGPKFRSVIEYKEESWLGRARYRLEGVIHLVHESEAEAAAEWVNIKDIPKNLIVAEFDGSWRGHVRWRRVGSGSIIPPTASASSSPSPVHASLPRSNATSRADLALDMDTEWQTLIDVSTLEVTPKQVRPIEKQMATESRRMWDKVTKHLSAKEFSEATREKNAIEQRQRDEAAERKRVGTEFVPVYFETDIESGAAKLTEEGRKALEEEMAEVDEAAAKLAVPAS
ncbi:hypothetical protein CYLTODRAFT_427684 [Cylindrobasidium torrendii FP15055 ss-10]|uniref:Oxysterol-binding protein n=1 Tax=Cylindrobasidium torrendii FP15055 ss-10 TaxID=1314674 RepID=A0A0D7ASU9_9AGAR|nr:hypothetical protein CYLTODRAFT_427684 [Cylindrobasidium torrendii FP15055 ss-10]